MATCPYVPDAAPNGRRRRNEPDHGRDRSPRLRVDGGFASELDHH